MNANDERMVSITRFCRQCRTPHSVKVRCCDLERWTGSERTRVQDCFPYLSPSEREFFFMTGICTEEGCEFQEHFRVHADGSVDIDETKPCHRGFDFYDADGNPCDSDSAVDMEPNEDKDEGGIDGYMDFSSAEEIYGSI